MNSSSTDAREIRKLGLPMFCFFCALAGLSFWKGHLFPVCFFGFLSALGLGFLCFPGIMKPVFSCWMKVVNIIRVITNTLLLALAYYLVLTPSALIRKAVGGKMLPTRPDREADSYWVERSEGVQSRERFIKRY